MFCSKCGNQIPDTAKFCPACGATVDVRAVAPASGSAAPAGDPTPAAPVAPQQPAPAAAAAPQQPTPAPTAVAPKRRRTPLIIAVAVVLVLVAGVAAALVLPRIFGGSTAADDETASNSSLANGPSATTSEYDIFFSSKAGGVCRAKPDGSSVELIYPVDVETTYAPALAVDGDTVFFVLRNFMDGSVASELHAIKTDGTGDTVIFKGKGYTADSGGWSNIEKVVVYGHVLYLLASVTRDENNDTYTTIITMNADGSDVQEHGTIPGNASYRGVVVTPDRVYYAQNEYGSTGSTTGTINSMSLDGGDFKELYRSSVGYVMDLGIWDGRLYFYESANGYTVISSVGTDGSDPTKLYEPPAQEGVYLVAVADGALYLQSWESNADTLEIVTWDLLRLPVDGGEVEVLAADLDLYNPTFTSAGGRLLIASNGQYAGATCGRLVSINYDGSNMVEYPLDEVA